MRFGFALGVALVLAPQAHAQSSWCEELWIDRNTVFDRAGQCFQSPLGQALFDNSDCVPGERPLTPLDQFIVSTLQERERQAGCSIDTSRAELSAAVQEHLDRLRLLWTVPIRAESEHSCGAYRGPARDLHAGISPTAPIIGRLEPGQNFNFSYDQMRGEWEYILVSDADYNRVAHGWVQGIDMTEELCGFIAG